MAGENGNGYVLFVWSPTGYTLREVDGAPPQVGHEFEDGGQKGNIQNGWAWYTGI